jgi:hypothetical protein
LLVAFMGVSTYRNLITNEVLYGAVFALIVPILCLYPVHGWVGTMFRLFGKVSTGWASCCFVPGSGLRIWVEATPAISRRL